MEGGCTVPLCVHLELCSVLSRACGVRILPYTLLALYTHGACIISLVFQLHFRDPSPPPARRRPQLASPHNHKLALHRIREARSVGLCLGVWGSGPPPRSASGLPRAALVRVCLISPVEWAPTVRAVCLSLSVLGSL